MGKKEILKHKREMATISRQIYDKGLTYSTGGNISVKLGDDQFLIKPADFCFGDMRAKDFITINKNGEILDGQPGNRPSSETKMHLAVYRDIKDAKAVIHTHSPYTMVFATSGKPIEAATTFAEEEIGLVPVAPYRDPGTQALADIVGKTLQTVEKGLYPPPNQPAIAVLLERHGVLLAGKNLKQTFYALESLETTARTLLWMKILDIAGQS
jgi:L-fuculose-phosphate aldolase